ncbi:glutamate/aspartate ABC transporter substrate-binding protein [Rhizobium leguminosarum]|uniref:glutamate/aspartate ABC transporter substrate-binding protein n=1 Tax=Rhizobium leguminosarum TaxID=384 RepID=UPI001C91664B|nr:glutamate/aspartate ABC transporter substrate-binding protein [Rhizobium leguminosarum]MBY3178692.1 glutamate/aspartate ABC transporter substrate-binding protein [Rhizobium leguminosarum]MBY5565481.1 glutamate/aspartate ABC transporter substrate-binding protein [Rhizobium leguminosarum]MBY5622174.1 glutamate/aspartate ABC transporter substrate-binding protein [Rhizobium leguminosarum]MBY5693341.1 glutamate/aspartate ABC transporter substrate-binding protein [Rhizobium leguminosarum]
MREHIFLAGVLSALAATTAAAFAGDSPTLAKIGQSGTISLGHMETSVPFSYYDQNQEVIGYSREIQLRIVEAVKAKLGLNSLVVRNVPITSQNRIPLIQNGTVDIECSSTTHNLERAKQVAFSNSIFLIQTRLLTATDSGLTDFEDLKGKTVVTMAGTTSERLLRAMNQDRQMGMSVISAKDQGESFQTLETGRAIAYMSDDAVLAGQKARARAPDKWQIVGKPQSIEVYGCLMRRDDPEFKKIADDVIAKLETSAEIDDLYKKWFETPVPPRGLNLGFPMSTALRALYKSPNDTASDDLNKAGR